MRLNNIEIRLLIERRRLKHWEIAAAVGINPCTLSRWLRQELTPERKEKVLQAIRELN